MNCATIFNFNLSFSAHFSCNGNGTTVHARFFPPTRLPLSRTRIQDPYPYPFFPFLGFHFNCPPAKANDIAPRNRGAIARKRRRFSANACLLELPLLPFDAKEVLVPSESKTLHLYEARYLALLEESLLRKKLFVHFVLDPITDIGASAGTTFAARYGCLVLIENVERLDVGALVSIRGIGRVKIVNFVQLQGDPYLRGFVKPVQDLVPDSESSMRAKVIEVKAALHSLRSLEIKLKVSKEELLQTRIANSLMWAEKEPLVDCDERFIPSLAERVSFAALQPVSRSTESELLKLQQEKLKAMDLKDTVGRLENSLALVQENISMVAAKLAIQSIEVQ